MLGKILHCAIGLLFLALAVMTLFLVAAAMTLMWGALTGACS